MTAELTVAETATEAERKRKLTLLRAIGLDRVSPEERALALNIAERYELDLLLKHLVIIEGRAAITRDGLLHVAHRDGHFDGIETTEPVIREYEGLGRFWTASATVWRSDMSHGFTYTGRFPFEGRGPKQVMKVYGPEMATKVAEVMALRRAFDVAMPTQEERWDSQVPTAEPEPPKSLAEKVAEKAAHVGTTTNDNAPTVDYVTGEILSYMPVEVSETLPVEAGELTKEALDAAIASLPVGASPLCGVETQWDSPCALDAGHSGAHIAGKRIPKARAATTTAKQTTPTTEAASTTSGTSEATEQCGSYSKMTGDRCRLAAGEHIAHRTANESWAEKDGQRA